MKINPRGYFANAKVLIINGATHVVYCEKCGEHIRIFFGAERCGCERKE